jgi:hypothetical protein
MNRRQRLQQARALRRELIADRKFMNELRKRLPELRRMGLLTKRQARLIKQGWNSPELKRIRPMISKEGRRSGTERRHRQRIYAVVPESRYEQPPKKHD